MHQTVCLRRSRLAIATPSDCGKMAPLHVGVTTTTASAMHQTACSHRSRVARTLPSDCGKMALLHAGERTNPANAMHQTACSRRSRLAASTPSDCGKMAPLHAGAGTSRANAMHQTACSRKSRWWLSLHRNSGRWHHCMLGVERLRPMRCTRRRVHAGRAVGLLHSIGLQDGTIACWGNNYYGQCDAPDGVFTQVAAGGQSHPRTAGRWHRCMLGPERIEVNAKQETANSRRLKWRSTRYRTSGKLHRLHMGQLRPVRCQTTYSLRSRVVIHSIWEDGTIACWGDNYYDCDAPDGVFTQVARSVITPWTSGSGTIAFWGYDLLRMRYTKLFFLSQVLLGDSNHSSVKLVKMAPLHVGVTTYGLSDAPDGVFTQVGVAYTTLSGLREDGTIACWGVNDFGQCDAPDGVFTQVAGGLAHSLGLREDGTVVCWGQNNSTANAMHQTVFFQRKSRARQFHSLGLQEDGTIARWGSNNYGQCDAPDGVFTQVAWRCPPQAPVID